MVSSAISDARNYLVHKLVLQLQLRFFDIGLVHYGKLAFSYDDRIHFEHDCGSWLQIPAQHG